MKVFGVLALIFVFVTGCSGSSNGDTTNNSTNSSSDPVGSQNPPPATSETCDAPGSLTIVAASDDGSHDGRGPDNVFDGSFAEESRWSSEGIGKWIIVDLGLQATVTAIEIAWYKGDTRSALFDVAISADGSNWDPLGESLASSGTTSGLEQYALAQSLGRYIRVTARGNTLNAWNSILELRVLGCSTGEPEYPVSTPGGSPGISDLDPSLPPSGNFELIDWYLSIPTDNDGSGTADSIREHELSSGYENPTYFYTASDGGMVFRCPVEGFKTSSNTSYTRTELREMLRRGDTSISTQGVNRNNWVFGSAPASARAAAGGVDGTLRATLAVNHVTTTGSSSQVGRVIIGQIHANDDEPVRLYYRKLPQNTRGSIYIAHEPIGKEDLYFELIGNRSSSASDPIDGIALDERFSYLIEVIGNTLNVTISRDGKADVSTTVDMSQSGYDAENQYQYFKAGVYNQNNTGSADDYVQATFYALENSHSGYAY